VAFGDPAFAAHQEGDPATAASTGFGRAGVRLKPLAGTREEVESIAGLFGPRATTWLGADATEAKIFDESAGHRFVHFATHALLDDENPLYSGFALAPPTPAERSQNPALDDFLQVYELFKLRTDAELVVCSACQTGLGRLRGGEGLVGMSRALFFGGAQALVLSLWPVPDEATAVLMQHLYTGVRRGRSVPAALAAAQAKVRQTQPDPFYWAAFVVVGLGEAADGR
jgi:CHAT domain-containing protein